MKAFSGFKVQCQYGKFLQFKKLIILNATKGDFFFLSLSNSVFLKIINLVPRSIISDVFEMYFLIQNQKGFFFFHFVLPLKCNCHFYICKVSIFDFSKHTGYNLLAISYSS